jgi:porin
LDRRAGAWPRLEGDAVGTRQVLAAVAALTAPHPTVAQPAPPPPPAFEEALTGGWGGARAALAARGVRVVGSVTAEVVAVPAGGRATGARAFGDADLRLRVDLERLAGWRGATAEVNGIGSAGGNPSDLAGDLQGVSNIAVPRRLRLLEAWLQQDLLDGRASLLVGLSDLNSEFYALQAAALFLNSSFGIGPEFSQSGLGGPSIFPATSLGARLGVRPRPENVLRVAVVNGVPLGFRRADGSARPFHPGDGALLVAELVHLVAPGGAGEAGAAQGPPGPRHGAGRDAPGTTHALKVALGGWRYTARFPAWEVAPAPARVGNHGAWLIAEGTVLRDPARPARRLRIFTQLALAAPRPNRITRFGSLGATARGLVPGRDDDELGLAVAVAWQGAAWREVDRAAGRRPVATETVLEASWLAAVTPWLTLQPDVQLVLHPGGEATPHGALVAALRAAVGL